MVVSSALVVVSSALVVVSSARVVVISSLVVVISSLAGYFFICGRNSSLLLSDVTCAII